MSVRFPSLPRRGLGVGLDVPWDARSGFGRDRARGDVLAPPLHSFLRSHAAAWSHAFFSWQPRDRAAPRLADYAAAWDDLCASLPSSLPRGLHHTALNLGSMGAYRRGELLEFTAALCERYDLRWVNEDVGLWSLAGRPLAYPLPPLLTDEGLHATIANTRECQRGLPVPLVLEFPGFARGVSVVQGDWHAYDFFRVLAEESNAPVTLDVGHLLSYQWWRGRRGDALFEELDRLPLTHCCELHLSGCEILGDRFVDAHHGRLLDEQLVLLEQLLHVCPNLRAITFEDPRFDERGAMTTDNQPSWDRLVVATASWAQQAHDAVGVRASSSPRWQSSSNIRSAHDPEVALAQLLYERGGTQPPRSDAILLDPGELDEAASVVRTMVGARVHRGTGGLRDWYPMTLAAWSAAHPEDRTLDAMLAQLCASPWCREWRESTCVDPGLALEEALYRFFCDLGVGDPSVREDEFLGAITRALAVTPRAHVRWPAAMRRAPGGCFAITERLVLHAALDGSYLRGPVTPLIAALLCPELAPPGGLANAGLPGELERVAIELRAMRLLA
jgi:uncharacterized protein (UPF0276 family)